MPTINPSISSPGIWQHKGNIRACATFSKKHQNLHPVTIIYCVQTPSAWNHNPMSTCSYRRKPHCEAGSGLTYPVPIHLVSCPLGFIFKCYVNRVFTPKSKGMLTISFVWDQSSLWAEDQKPNIGSQLLYESQLAFLVWAREGIAIKTSYSQSSLNVLCECFVSWVGDSERGRRRQTDRQRGEEGGKMRYCM